MCGGRGRYVFETHLTSFGGPQINVIEDKRKFDIMEFVSWGGGKCHVTRSLLGRGRQEGRGKDRRVPRHLCPLPTLSPRCCVWWRPRLPISSRAMRSWAGWPSIAGTWVPRWGSGQRAVVERGGRSKMPLLARFRRGGWGHLKRPSRAQLHQLVLNSARERRDMEQRHVLLKQKVRVSPPAGGCAGPRAPASACQLPGTLLCPQELGGEEPEPSLKEGPGGLVMEGHLFKRASNAFKTWSR